MPRVAFFLLLFFVAELFVIITVGSRIGALATISLMFLSIVVGSLIIKLRARYLMQALHSQDGRKALESNMRLLVLPLAGLLFIIPGFLSDLLAILLLIPGLDKIIARPFLKRVSTVYFGNGAAFSSRGFSETFYSSPNGADPFGAKGTGESEQGTVVDGTYTELADKELPHRTKE